MIKNWSTNIRYSEYEISSYKIPGNSKAKLCEDQIFSNSGGINSALAASCQKIVESNIFITSRHNHT